MSGRAMMSDRAGLNGWRRRFEVVNGHRRDYERAAMSEARAILEQTERRQSIQQGYGRCRTYRTLIVEPTGVGADVTAHVALAESIAAVLPILGELEAEAHQ